MVKKILRFLFLKVIRRVKENIFQCKIFWSQLKLKKAKVIYGKKTYGNSFYIHNRGTIILGEKVFLNSKPNGSSFVTSINTYFIDSKVEIGNNCRLNGTIIHCNLHIKIGNNCLFGPGTVIVDNDSHRISIDYDERIKPPVMMPIVINDNVWVGMNCIILKGVTIGENSIVAAGSIVTKDVPSNVLCAGIPAKVIKMLT